VGSGVVLALGLLCGRGGAGRMWCGVWGRIGRDHLALFPVTTG